MKPWIGPSDVTRHAWDLPVPGPRSDDGAPRPAEPVDEDPDAEMPSEVLREVAAAALLVSRGTVTRIVICNSQAPVDLGDVRLVADAIGVEIEPIVRVGGGGFDFALTRRSPTRE